MTKGLIFEVNPLFYFLSRLVVIKKKYLGKKMNISD
jgi:hypothetical protein